MDYLVTGGAGFIGSYIAESLIQKNHSVTVLDNLSTGKLENIKHLINHEKFSMVVGDASSKKVMNSLAGKADVIIHLAAMVGVQRVLDNPVGMVENNVSCTSNVLRAAHKYNCHVFVASSSEVYGKLHKDNLCEDDCLIIGCSNLSRWSYATSKLLDEFLALGYAQQHQLSVTVGRFFNTVGPRQSDKYGMVIPRLVKQALKNEPMTIYEDGLQTRCFSDVRDIASAVLSLVETEEAKSQVFNIGNTQEITILQLAEYIRTLTSSNSELVFIPYQSLTAGFDEVRRRKPDLAKLKSVIEWMPHYTLEETITEIIQYHKHVSMTDNLVAESISIMEKNEQA